MRDTRREASVARYRGGTLHRLWSYVRGIDIALARRKGRTRLRWRLAAIVGGVPAVAAIAAVAVIVSGALPVRTSGPVAAHGSAAAPHRFNPLIPYASFGWLPAGKRITSAYTSAASEELGVGPTGSPTAGTSWSTQPTAATTPAANCSNSCTAATGPP